MTASINGTTGVTFPDASVQGTAASGFGFKNRIINGAMMIDQRNAGASVSLTGGGFTVDRWKYYVSQSSKLTAQQNAGSVTPPVGFINYLGITSSSAYTVGSTDEFDIYQSIEGLNISDLAWGTPSAKPITISFQVYSSLTGTFGGSLRNSASTRCYPFTYAISVANTWTSISITIPGDTTGTWLTTNGIGITLFFSMGAGSSNIGTAGAWASAGYVGAIGQTNLVATSGATFYITGVQLEKGSTATSFDYRPYGTELALCQRYYQYLTKATWEPVTAQPSGAANIISCLFKVTMRTAPTVTLSNVSVYSGGTPSVNTTGIDGCAISFGNNIGNSQWLTTITAEL